MRRRWLHLPVLLLILLGYTATVPACAGETNWTERKLGKVILRADKAARQKKWGRAIKYGERMLKGSDILDRHSDARYINLLKNLNIYYDKADRLEKVTSRVKEAYILSEKHLGPSHATTKASRLLYYKTLVTHKEYLTAIGLVRESISVLGKTKDDDFRLLHYRHQLYSLYGRTNQFEKEEETLLQLLKLNKRLLGDDIQDNIKIILSLARTYCLQNKAPEFDELMEMYHLEYEC